MIFNLNKQLILILIVITSLFHNQTFATDAQPKSKIDLFDLGYNKSDAQPNYEFQKNLENRRFYLEQHQKWGLMTLGLMALALTSAGDGNPPIEHVMLGTATAVTYGISAYYGIAAPTWSSNSNNKPSGGSALHRNLAWIHVPGMILTPILGYMAKKKLDENKELTGAEKYHKDVAAATAGALAVSVLAVSFEF